MWFPDVNQIKTKPKASKKKANKNSDAKAKKVEYISYQWNAIHSYT